MKTRAIISLIASVVLSVSATAQTIYDGLMYSERNYEGTARTVAMGNAFTALGGDPGAVVLNPAGSAVTKHSFLSLTPSVSVSANSTASHKYSNAKMTLPNFAMTFNFNTSRNHGLKSVSFGFVINHTNSFNNEVYYSGANDQTTFMGAMASEAQDSKLLGSQLIMEDAYNYDPYKYVVGYQSGMISTFGGNDDKFVGASELIYDHNSQTFIELAGPINQTYGRVVSGKKKDYLINLGFNISDFLYLGANLGITSMDYSYNDYIKEEAINHNDFELELESGEKIYFTDMKYSHTFSAESSGCYGKFGFILTPGYGIRLGAAIQTPTASTIREYWYMDGETHFTDARYDGTAGSPEDSDRYSFREPWRANFGLAYTLGKVAALSVDYEYCDYRSMKFKRDRFDEGRAYFDTMNSLIKETFTSSHMLRAGLEIKPTDRIALRAGYGLTTSPDKMEAPEALFGEDAAKGLGWIDSRSVKARQNVALGVGLSSKNSFFADFAFKYDFTTEENFLLYDSYIEGVPVPVVNIKNDTWKILFTFGWKF